MPSRPRDERPATYDAEIAALGARVRKIRLIRGWTLEVAAERTGVDWKHLQKIEAAQLNPTTTCTFIGPPRGIYVQSRFDAILRGSPRTGRYAQAVRVAKLTGIPVADVYVRWKQGKGFCVLHGWTARKNHDCIVCAGQRKQRPA